MIESKLKTMEIVCLVEEKKWGRNSVDWLNGLQYGFFFLVNVATILGDR